jgi:hypothetical protein
LWLSGWAFWRLQGTVTPGRGRHDLSGPYQNQKWAVAIRTSSMHTNFRCRIRWGHGILCRDAVGAHRQVVDILIWHPNLRWDLDIQKNNGRHHRSLSVAISCGLWESILVWRVHIWRGCNVKGAPGWSPKRARERKSPGKWIIIVSSWERVYVIRQSCLCHCMYHCDVVKSTSMWLRIYRCEVWKNDTPSCALCHKWQALCQCWNFFYTYFTYLYVFKVDFFVKLSIHVAFTGLGQ